MTGRPVQDAARPGMGADPALAAQLRRRALADQRRWGDLVARAGSAQPADMRRCLAQDRRTARWLLAAVRLHGWPGYSRVGAQGAGDAWLLAQHADAEPGAQPALLEALADAVRRGEAPPRHLVYLTDRVLTRAGLPQRYGTQFRRSDDTIGLFPVEDPDRLEERRLAVGLGPVSHVLDANRERIGAMLQLAELRDRVSARPLPHG